MEKKILGRSWDEIRSAQQGGRLDRPIDLSKSGVEPPTPDDYALLALHGSIEGLEKAGLHGVAYRLRHATTEK